jgi:predicted DNA-binding transcriptional regulator AlpA
MSADLFLRKPVQSARPEPFNTIVDPRPDPLLTPEDVAQRLNVSRDWVWDHSSRKSPFLPVIRVSDGLLRYRASQIEEFVNERERMSVLRRKRR